MTEVHKTLILGSGPAGYTAAIYAARANLAPVLLTGRQPGGQLTITSEVENYPGFPEGVMGPEMMEKFREQAARFGTVIHDEMGSAVDLKKRPFTVTTENGVVFQTQTLIVSTGASALYLGLPNEKALQGRGVSACATCDGFFFKNKVVYVVGGGDSACEEANFLTKYASKVFLVVRRDALRASKIMQDRALKNPKIEVVWNSTVSDVLDVKQGKVTAVELTDTKNGTKRQAPADGLFLAIGHQPNTELFRGLLNMDDKGYIVTVPGKTATNLPVCRLFYNEDRFRFGDVDILCVLPVRPKWRLVEIEVGAGMTRFQFPSEFEQGGIELGVGPSPKLLVGRAAERLEHATPLGGGGHALDPIRKSKVAKHVTDLAVAVLRHRHREGDEAVVVGEDNAAFLPRQSLQRLDEVDDIHQLAPAVIVVARAAGAHATQDGVGEQWVFGCNGSAAQGPDTLDGITLRGGIDIGRK